MTNTDFEDDDDLDFDPVEPAANEETQSAVEEKERKRWEDERREEQIREVSLRAWEKERLADAEGREARLVPLEEPDTFAGAVKAPLPRVAKPAEKSARRYEPDTGAPDDAEIELTAMIAECRHFMREMAFESARLTPDARDRIRFIDSARGLAETGAMVGRSIAAIRHPHLAEPEEKKRARR